MLLIHCFLLLPQSGLGGTNLKSAQWREKINTLKPEMHEDNPMEISAMALRSIRGATAEDVPNLTQIRNDAHAKKVAHGDYAWGQDGDGFSEGWVLRSLSRRAVYVVEQECLPVATFSLDWEDEEYWGTQEPIAGYVHGLSVKKGFNGLGLGSFVIDWCANQVRGVDRRFVRLGCDPRNTKLCAYYESLGFIRVGIAPKSEHGDYVESLYERSVD